MTPNEIYLFVNVENFTDARACIAIASDGSDQIASLWYLA